MMSQQKGFTSLRMLSSKVLTVALQVVFITLTVTPYELTAQSTSADTTVTPKSQDYYGKLIGDLIPIAHDVQGTVYAASDNTFYILNFSYDGTEDDVFFWGGATEQPSSEGFIIPDEYGTTEALGKYSNRTITITMKPGQKISDIKWLSVWNRKAAENYGYILIPDNFDLPKEANLGPMISVESKISSGNVTVKDTKTIFISRLFYPGLGPDVFFLVGKGEPNKYGIKVPDEKGSLKKLKGYAGRDAKLRLPEGVTVFDIDWLSVYCIQYSENLGDVRIPKSLNIPVDYSTLQVPVTKAKGKKQSVACA